MKRMAAMDAGASSGEKEKNQEGSVEQGEEEEDGRRLGAFRIEARGA